MIPIIMMIVGGILILISIFGFLAYLFEPLIRTYRIVIKREDDYTHYTTPRNFAMLQTARKQYCIGLGVMLVSGIILFSIGSYLVFGERGFGFLFSTHASEQMSELDTAVSDEMADRLNESGDYVDDEGNVYTNYIVVKGKDVYFNEEKTGSVEDFRSYIQSFHDLGRIYVVDGYAASSVYHEVIDILDENGFDYEAE